MVDIVILCPVEVEFKIISQILKKRKPTTYQGLSFAFGRLRTQTYDWEIAIMEPSNRQVSFGAYTSEVITKLNPKYIILAGIAGSIKDAEIGDLVIGIKAYHYEGSKETVTGSKLRPEALRNGSTDLLTVAERLGRKISNGAYLEFGNTRAYSGAIASGNKVLAYTGSFIHRRIDNAYNDTIAVEMEAYDFSSVAVRANIPYLNIRGISDMINEKAKSDASGHQELAAKKVALFLEKLIPSLPIPKQQRADRFEVQVTKESFTFFGIRKTIPATLTFRDDFIELQLPKENIILKHLITVDHVRMRGDLARSWVKVIYETQEDQREIFLTTTAKLGVGYWTGASKNIFQQFETFQERFPFSKTA